MANPKYSLIEIEKRWLVNKDKLPDLSALKRIEVTDKYFPGTRTRLRKMTDTSNNDTQYKLTKKYEKLTVCSGPLATLYLTENEYTFYNKPDGNILIKNLYHYYFSGTKFLIEIFLIPEVNFILLEAEASSEEELNKLAVPDFAARDVTSEKEYEGYSISCRGNS